MLPDLERKLLRILYNYFAQHRHMPTMAELTVKTGKRDAEITDALRHMEQERYITWENNSSTQHVVLLEGWERPSTQRRTQAETRRSTTQTMPSDGTEYWTNY
ncbi:hypothetical protein [Paenibacillus polymyxa]|uniref:hypothetical protein n=1 Tax=Paenibacillus polymyxa TaxID=1406 RepID=UPI0020253CFE|nr:hypothetical protein [Paenibacillus polymyxa]URJ60834.1 hypothetical protein MF622_000494 [Paenibacillus polymyxa]